MPGEPPSPPALPHPPHTEGTTLRRPPRPWQLGDLLRGLPTTRRPLPQRLPAGIAAPGFKATGIFLALVFSESAPVIALHLMLLLALPEVRATRRGRAEAAGSECGLDLNTLATARPALELPGWPRTRKRGCRGHRAAGDHRAPCPGERALASGRFFLNTQRARAIARRPQKSGCKLKLQNWGAARGGARAGARRATGHPGKALPLQSGSSATDNQPGARIAPCSAIGKPL